MLKMDIEGGEINLFQVNDAIFRRISEYIVEVHSDDLFNMMVEKCARNNYEIKVYNWQPIVERRMVKIVYARKKDSQPPRRLRPLGDGFLPAVSC